MTTSTIRPTSRAAAPNPATPATTLPAGANRLNDAHLELLQTLIVERRQRAQACALSATTALAGEVARRDAALLHEIERAVQRYVHVEAACMPAICGGWYRRKTTLELKGKTAERDAEAYMQGALGALVAAGPMSIERANQIAFLTAVGRLPEYMQPHASKFAHATESSGSKL